MQRGEIWFATTPGGDRPVLVLTRDPVSDRIGSVMVAALPVPTVVWSPSSACGPTDDVPTDRVVNVHNPHTLARGSFRRRITTLSPLRTSAACRTLADATSC